MFKRLKRLRHGVSDGRAKPSASALVVALALASILCFGGCTSSRSATSLERYGFNHPQMGTTFNIVVYAPDSAIAEQASSAAFARIDTLNQHLSDYLVDSELNQLSNTAGTRTPVSLSDDLWSVLSEAQKIAIQSNGAFDVTVGPLTRLWRWGIRRNELPAQDDLETARQAVGFGNLLLDHAAKKALLATPGMRLDLGGIAKGYAADEALAVIQSFDLPRTLVDAGGDIRVGESPPGKKGWRVGTYSVSPRGELVQEERYLSNAAVATSGATYRYVEAGGIRYSHIVDPRNGMGVTAERIVTVVATSGMKADALASALSVMGPTDGFALAASIPGVDARFIETIDGRRVVIDSAGLDSTFKHVELTGKASHN